jgi:hypothetical protein
MSYVEMSFEGDALVEANVYIQRALPPLRGTHAAIGISESDESVADSMWLITGDPDLLDAIADAARAAAEGLRAVTEPVTGRSRTVSVFSRSVPVDD